MAGSWRGSKLEGSVILFMDKAIFPTSLPRLRLSPERCTSPSHQYSTHGATPDLTVSSDGAQRWHRILTLERAAAIQSMPIAQRRRLQQLLRDYLPTHRISRLPEGYRMDRAPASTASNALVSATARLSRRQALRTRAPPSSAQHSYPAAAETP
jgi:hypothetical protein